MTDTFDFELTSSSSSVPADCRFAITLERSISRYDVPGRAQVWRARIIVKNWFNIQPNCFVYRRGMADEAGDVRDEFIAVASPVDLEELPVGAPFEDSANQMYLMAEVDLLSKSQQLLDDTWRLIKEDVSELIRSLTYTCELSVEDEFTAGEYPETEPEPTPTPAPEESSSGVAPTCPADAIVQLKVTASNDPDFPVDTIIATTGSSATPPICYRQWSADGDVTGKTLVLTTSTVNHTFSAVLDGVGIASGGLADDYKAIINYTRGLGEEFTLQVIGE